MSNPDTLPAEASNIPTDIRQSAADCEPLLVASFRGDFRRDVGRAPDDGRLRHSAPRVDRTAAFARREHLSLRFCRRRFSGSS